MYTKTIKHIIPTPRIITTLIDSVIDKGGSERVGGGVYLMVGIPVGKPDGAEEGITKLDNTRLS
jgi:hypothetical protein